MIATVKRPSCPTCRRDQTVPLAREGDRQRFQCVACTETFWGQAETVAEALPAPAPAQRFSHVAIAAPESGGLRAGPADPVARCEKCKKPYFKGGKRYEAHVAKCDGTPYVEKVRRPRRYPAASALPPEPTKVYDQSIAALLARKAALEAEVRGIDAAISEIQKMKGAGGSAPLPFSGGTPPASPTS